MWVSAGLVHALLVAVAEEVAELPLVHIEAATVVDDRGTHRQIHFCSNTRPSSLPAHGSLERKGTAMVSCHEWMLPERPGQREILPLADGFPWSHTFTHPHPNVIG